MTTETSENADSCPDIFGRELIARKMCDLICSRPSEVISPAVLDGAWGCGKTTHALRMERIINKEKSKTHKCIYWNAAMSDYANEPLPMFVTAMYKYVPDSNKNKFVGDAQKLCGTFLMHMLGNLAMQLITKPVGIDAEKVIEAGCSAVAETQNENLLSVAFHQFIDDVANIESRIQLAKSIVDALSEDKEVIFIIDELDRCRPDFALKMLESIKHLFSKSRCKFYLVMNKVSMIASVRRLYGLNEEDADLYLNKFIKINFRLPSKVYKKVDGCNINYFEYLLEQNGLNEFRGNTVIKIVFEKIANHRKINLREVEKMADAVAIIHSMVSDESNRGRKFETLYIFLVAYLFVFESNLLERLFSGLATADELLICLGFRANESEENSAINQEVFLEKHIQYLARILCADNPEAVVGEICSETHNFYPHDWLIMVRELRSLVSFAMMS